MPSGLIKQQHGVCTGRYRDSDLGQVKRHAFGIAAGQNEPRRFSLGQADGAVEVGRFCQEWKKLGQSPRREEQAALLPSPVTLMGPRLKA